MPGFSLGLASSGEFSVQRMFFSLVNAFSIGFREFSIGKWLRLLTPREYEVKATNWARPVAGIQSLATVYFFALWLLTYFGRPFE